MEHHSKNFSVSELRCRCSKCKVLQPNMIHPLALEALQRIRDEFGKPIVLTSAYRCADHPDEAKKSKPGTHQKGTAFDISVSSGTERFKLLELAMKHGFNGIGIAQSFIHIDFKRPSGTTWTY